MANKPASLAYKDLKKDTGKGFYHWMRPYQTFEPQLVKPANVLPPRLPRAFVLRYDEFYFGLNLLSRLSYLRLIHKQPKY